MLRRLLVLVLLAASQPAASQVVAGSRAGFTDLDSLALEFVRSLKAAPEELRVFCSRVALDDATVTFLRKRYGWTPRAVQSLEQMSTDPVPMLAAAYSDFAQDFKERLQRRGHLDSLEYVTRERKEHRFAVGNSSIPWTEAFFYFKSKDAGYRCAFGELYQINGRWKAFSDPKFNTFPRSFPPSAETSIR